MKKRSVYINIICRRHSANMSRVSLWLKEPGVIEINKTELNRIMGGKSGYNDVIISKLVNECDGVLITTRELFADKAKFVETFEAITGRKAPAAIDDLGMSQLTDMFALLIDMLALKYINERMPILCPDQHDEASVSGVKVGNERIRKLGNIMYRVCKRINCVGVCEDWLEKRKGISVASIKAYMYGQLLPRSYKAAVEDAVNKRTDIVLGCDVEKVTEEIYTALEEMKK